VDLVKHIVSEPGTDSPESYARRVRRLAALYVVLFASSLTGAVLLAWQGKHFVTLAQRSNVETLVILFFLVFFAYLAALSSRGAIGALRLATFAVRERAAAEKQKADALGPPRGEGPTVAVNALLERESAPGTSFTIPVADEHGPMGSLLIDGATIRHVLARRDGSVNLLAYFVRQVSLMLDERHEEDIDIVEWGSLDEDGLMKWSALTRFARALGDKLGAQLWPVHRLSDADCAELERRLSAICPALRSEGFLPAWEYSADHKLPVIPEPLGLVTLGRSEKRVDPLPSMAFATLVVVATVLLIAVFVIWPPWVPG
jgi:hypothetical protein